LATSDQHGSKSDKEVRKLLLLNDAPDSKLLDFSARAKLLVLSITGAIACMTNKKKHRSDGFSINELVNRSPSHGDFGRSSTDVWRPATAIST